MDTIKQIRTKYAALGGKAAKIAVNRRVVQLLSERYEIQVDRRVRDTWITGRTGYCSSRDAELADCYATALLERAKIQRRTTATLQEMAA